MLKNIIDNPNDEKYRVVKQNNPKIKEALTKYYNGQQLLKLIGFQEFYEPQNRETVLKMPQNVSISYLKMQKIDLDHVATSFFLAK